MIVRNRIVDPRSGKLDSVSLNFTGDVPAPEWPLKARLWRFRPAELGEK
jgi:hypothetical protein